VGDGHMKQSNLLLLISVTLLFTSLFVSLPLLSPSNTNSDLKTFSESSVNNIEYVTTNIVESPQILISGDDNPFWDSLDGDGSEQDPYIIEGLLINVNHSIYNFAGIEIRYSTHHVIIRDCVINGALINTSWGPDVTGSPLCLFDSSNIKVIDNIFNLTTSASIFGGTNCLVENNTFIGHKIENETRYLGMGIHIDDDSQNCTIRGNAFTNLIFAVQVNNAETCSVIDNTMMYCGTGIDTYRMNSCVFSQNNISYCSEHGMNIVYSNDTIISDNLLEHNLNYGMRFTHSLGNEITENRIMTTVKSGVQSGWGVFLDSGSHRNMITWNSFIDNYVNTYCDTPDNKFDYNYYSDYTGTDANNDLIGDTPYSISGEAEIHDIHPRITSDAIPIIVDDMSPILVISVASTVVLVIVITAVFIIRKKADR